VGALLGVWDKSLTISSFMDNELLLGSVLSSERTEREATILEEQPFGAGKTNAKVGEVHKTEQIKTTSIHMSLRFSSDLAK